MSSTNPPGRGEPSLPVGRHRAKISPMQVPSEATRRRAASLDGQTLEPSDLALAEWQALGLDLPDMRAVRTYRLGRVREMLRRSDYAGIVVADPLNMRYASDSSNMQVWCSHNAVRYCFVATEGPVILFEFPSCRHLSDHLDLIDEVRPATAWYYFGAGPRVSELAGDWAAEIADLVRAHGGGNIRLAIDRCNPEGIAALHSAGIETFNGEAVMEQARPIKSREEIKAMRCAIAAAEQSMRVMQEKLAPGISEMRLWSYLHAENIARGGEWIETRLLSSGPRTNPWFHECSQRLIQAGDLVGFDTDMIGPYGMCVDISRTWLCGSSQPTAEQRRLYSMAHEQIGHNQGLLKAGRSFRELSEKGLLYPEDEFYGYTAFYHGVGMCDEYPIVYYPQNWEATGYDDVLHEGMVLSVESFVGRTDGGEGVKLEEQVLITRDGAEPLSRYPYEPDLLSLA